jgi:CheY-like chemotaxis protein/putative methionine-R-sulfoxide reductase with GAF domain
MPEGPQKVLVIGPIRPGGEAVVSALGAGVQVVRTDGDGALDLLRDQTFAAVLVESGDFLALERGLVGQQSTLLLNALGEGVCLTDADGQIVWANQRFAGYDAATRARIAAVCRQSLKAIGEGADSAASRRAEVASADGQRFFEVIVSALAGQGSRRHAAAIVWDVSSTRRRQQKQAAIDQAGEELISLNADAIRKMNTGERLRVLEQKIVKFAHELLSFDHFAIRVIDERSNKLELVMSKGLPSAAMEVELYALSEGNGISGYVAASGRSYLCADTTLDPRYVTGIEGCRSSLTVPLRLHDRTIGIFNVESARANAFTEEDRQFAEAFARPIALALHMLNLLVVERATTGAAIGGSVEGELAEPLTDLEQVAARLKQAAASDPAVQRLVDMITADIDSIKRRVKDVAAGPRNVLGAERVLADVSLDPILSGKRVLVADDEPRIRQVVRDVLRARGAEVVICEDGASAIEVLSGNARPAASPAGPGSERAVGPAPAAAPRTFDLLISDIKLPDKTGYEIFAAAKKSNPNLPVILMTGFGYDPHHSIVRASQEGLSCVLFKPFQAERLLEEVHKALAPKA